MRNGVKTQLRGGDYLVKMKIQARSDAPWWWKLLLARILVVVACLFALMSLITFCWWGEERPLTVVDNRPSAG